MNKKQPKNKIIKLHPDLAARPQNIVFISDNNRITALKSMFDMVHDPKMDFNAAVWSNTGTDLSGDDLQKISYWCNIDGIALSNKRVSGKNGFLSLRREFNKAARRVRNSPEEKQAVKLLQNHVLRRLETLSEAFPEGFLYYH